jgi:hypothetical protein
MFALDKSQILDRRGASASNVDLLDEETLLQE